jgi:metallo-beta-lactamase family protein
MIELEFIGAARTVTGSKHVLRSTRATVLLDCGLFQGHRREANDRNRSLPVALDTLDAVVLSHAHIDHSGALPMLYQKGYRGPIYATPATRDLCAPMLADAAAIQAADARHIQRLIEREHLDLDPVQPLFTPDDVLGVLGQMIAISYHRRHVIAPGVALTFLDAGHVLGSAVVVLDIDDEGAVTRLAFTGDLGRPHVAILRDPQVPEGVNCLLSESTYGDRVHRPIAETADALAEVVNRTHARGGKVVIPSFALERAQEVIYELRQLRMAKRIPALPVYVDSPLTVKLTDVFKLHPDCYDREAYALLHSGHSPFEFEGLEYVTDVEQSKIISQSDGPCIIISASGMCEAGRVLHHLRTTVESTKNTVVIVGFQAEHTLGRRIAERRKEVRIFGVMRPLAAEVVVLDGFSAHADQAGLLAFAEAVRERGPLQQVILIHGEPPAQRTLSALLSKRGFPSVAMPKPGDRIRL